MIGAFARKNLLIERWTPGRQLWLMRTGTWQADLTQTGSENRLACDKRGPAGGTALLTVIVGEHHALFRNAVDIRRLVTYEAKRISADIGNADVIAPDHEDIGLVLCLGCACN